MSRRNSAVEMVLSDIADSNSENGFGEFVLVNMIQDGTQRWQVGQFLLSVEAPHRYEDDQAYLPVATFKEGTGEIRTGRYVCADLILQIPDPRLKQNTLNLPAASRMRPILSLEFVWVIERQRKYGDRESHSYRPAMFINHVSDTESLVMMLDKTNQEPKRKSYVRTASIQRYDPPANMS